MMVKKKKKKFFDVEPFTSIVGPVNIANITNHAKKYGDINEKTWILPLIVGLAFLAIFLFSKKIEDPWVYLGTSILFILAGIGLFFWDGVKQKNE